MRIVLPVHHFPPRYVAGAELYTYRLAKWLQAHGHEVEVIAIEDIESGSATKVAAVHDHYHGVPVWRLSFNLLKAPRRQLWEFDNPLLGEWFTHYFQRQRPDLAHFQAGYLIGVAPIFAAHQARVPIVLTLHDYWYLCPQHTLQRSDGRLCAAPPQDPLECARCRLWNRHPYHHLERWPKVRALAAKFPWPADGELMALRRQRAQAALDCVAQVIALSHFMAGLFAEHVDAERLVLCRPGIDIERFQKRPERGVGPVLRFGYVGQVAAHKGVHLLIEAFQSLQERGRQLELHIWGGGNPAYIALLKQKAARDPRIVFHGRFAHERLPEILSTLDYVAVPSVWYENSPLAILEAYAAHVPVISADQGGMAELVNHGQDGLQFRIGDAGDLARALQRIVDEPELTVRLQQGVRMRSVRTEEEEMYQLLSIYETARAIAMTEPCKLDDSCSVKRSDN
jgi:glycosyltransferase involved in cell wall biosynthesis